MADCINVLKEWTGKARATIIFDSTVDEFTTDGLFNKVREKPNIAIIGFTTDGDVFGGFYSVKATRQGVHLYDPNMFIFSFESHGRCMTPQRFVLKSEAKWEANVFFWKNDSNGFVWFRVDYIGGFFLGNERSDSICEDVSEVFEGLEDTTLSGMTGLKPEDRHHCARLVAIQLE